MRFLPTCLAHTYPALSPADPPANQLPQIKCSFPNLRHVCFHGNKRNTPGQLTYPVDNFYEGDSPPSPLVTSYVDGDGIVDIKSLKACENVQGMNTEVIAIEGEEHVQILHSEELARQVLAFLVGDHDRQTH